MVLDWLKVFLHNVDDFVIVGQHSFFAELTGMCQLVRSRSPSPLPRLSRTSSPIRSESPTRAQLTQSSRHARLVSRFSDLYAVERLEAQTILRRYVDDLEMVQKIIFIAAVESFRIAKLAYRQLNCENLDLYDLQSSVNDVINAMNVNPRISFPPETDFVLISTLIRETCRVAFAMQTLEPPWTWLRERWRAVQRLQHQSTTTTESSQTLKTNGLLLVLESGLNMDRPPAGARVRTKHGPTSCWC
ncbi:hypothetical protein WMY93_010584 [Mugilogobius chulae]|uniref:Mitochondria-eating protein n=1 Tax=Mugilogobius chulae TaxID=88201 RepID=A0AAW0P8X9_9GOBI